MRTRALIILALVLTCARAGGAEGVKFRLFDWLTGNDASLHQQITAHFKLDSTRLPTLTALPGGGLRLENPGGAPSAIAWAPLDLKEPGLYTLAFEARWEGEGDHGRANASLASKRLDFEPGREWTAHAMTMRQVGEVGPSSMSFGLRGRQGRLEIRGVDLVRVPFDARVVRLDERLWLQVSGRVPADAALAWRSGEDVGTSPLGDLSWTERDGVPSAALQLPKGAFYDWIITRGGRTVVVGERIRLRPVPPVERGPMRHPIAVRDDGTMLVQGTPFFPLGLYLHEGTPEAIERATEVGVNLVLVPDGEKATASVEAARARRMHAIVLAEIPPESDKLEDAVATMVKRLSSLPLFAWTAVDEPDLKPQYTAAAVERIRRTLSRLDGRPLYQSNHSPQSFWTVGTACDILAVDPYPLSAVPRPITTIGQWMDEAREAVGPGHSVWCVQQAFAEAPFWPKAPTPEQLRAMTWVALNHGARGIVYYAVHEILAPGSPDLRWDLRRTPLWREIASETATIRSLEPFLLRVGGPVRMPVAGSFDASLWDDGQGDVLMAIVNVAEADAEAIIGLPPPGLVDMRIAPDGPAVQAKDGRIAVRLPGYGVLLLRGRAPRQETH